MCQIIYKAEKKPFDFERIIKYVNQAIQYNRDGWGIAHNKINKDGITERIKLIRGVSSYPEFIIKTIRALNVSDNDEFAIHLRMATHGVISLGNCHPFLIGTGQTEWQEYDSINYPVMFHNGVLSGYSSVDKKSDSYQLAEKISKDIYREGQLFQFITDDNFRNKILEQLNQEVCLNKFLFILPKINKAINSVLRGKWNIYGDVMTSSPTASLIINSPIESKKSGIISQPVRIYGFRERKPEKPAMKESIFSMDIDKKILKEAMKNIPVNQWNKGDVFISNSTTVSFWYGLSEITDVYESGSYSTSIVGTMYKTYSVKDDDELLGSRKVNLSNYTKVCDAISKDQKEFDILKGKVTNMIDSKNFKNKVKVSGIGKVPMTTVWYALLMLSDKMQYSRSYHGMC